MNVDQKSRNKASAARLPERSCSFCLIPWLGNMEICRLWLTHEDEFVPWITLFCLSHAFSDILHSFDNSLCGHINLSQRRKLVVDITVGWPYPPWLLMIWSPALLRYASLPGLLVDSLICRHAQFVHNMNCYWRGCCAPSTPLQCVFKAHASTSELTSMIGLERYVCVCQPGLLLRLPQGDLPGRWIVRQLAIWCRTDSPVW